MTHAVEDVELAGDVRPDGQLVHIDEPAAEKVPCAHALHDDTVSPLLVLYEPAVHASHTVVLPVAAEKVPAAHGIGVLTPTVQYAPAGQSVHSAVAAPPAEKVPAGHGFVVPDACPARQKKRGGQGACCVLATVTFGQKKPAAHGFAVMLVLPVARHEPAVHARQEDTDVYVAPPGAYVPAGHGFTVPDAWPAPQK